jgi:hypothetical protein
MCVEMCADLGWLEVFLRRSTQFDYCATATSSPTLTSICAEADDKLCPDISCNYNLQTTMLLRSLVYRSCSYLYKTLLYLYSVQYCILYNFWPHQRIYGRVITTGWASGWVGGRAEGNGDEQTNYPRARITKFGRYIAYPL